jgi:hypothetical protein
LYEQTSTFLDASCFQILFKKNNKNKIKLVQYELRPQNLHS